jgi:hypothetical protein
MDAKYYAYNQTRGCFLSGSLTPVDAGLEPLRVLKVLIEGLAPDSKSGLWLTHFRSVPVARTLSPFDLVYLDSDFRIVHAVELSTDGEFAPFKGQPSSALVLPYQSIASTQTRNGDQLIVRAAEDTRVATSHQRVAPVPVEQPDILPVEAEPVARLATVSSQMPSGDRSVSPLEQFLAQQSAISAGRGRVQQNTKSLLDLSPAERAPIPTTQSPVAQSAPAVAEPAQVPRPSIHAVPSPVPLPRESRSGPTRTARIAPPSMIPPPANNAPSAFEPAASQHPPEGASQPSSRKVEPFPLRKTPPSHVSEPVFRPSDIDAGRQQPPEKLSLLMRVLRLQFLKRDPTSRQTLPGDEAAVAGRTIPDWAMRFVRWMYPEYDIATVAEVAVQPSYNAKTQFKQETKPSLDMQFVKWLYPELTFRQPHLESTPSDRRLSARLLKPGLVAYYFTGGPPRAHNIANISITGFYLQTEERWMPGTIIRMTLQMIGSKGDEPTDTLTVHSRVVRWGADGEGFEFVLAGFLDEPLPISYGRADRLNRRLES